MPSQLKNGVQGAPGGFRPGAGRPSDWLRERCQEFVDKRKLVEFLANVAEGQDMEQVVTDKGEVVKVPASVKDRIRATEILLNRGFGKDVDMSTDRLPEQSIINAAKAHEILKALESKFENNA